MSRNMWRYGDKKLYFNLMFLTLEPEERVRHNLSSYNRKVIKMQGLCLEVCLYR